MDFPIEFFCRLSDSIHVPCLNGRVYSKRNKGDQANSVRKKCKKFRFK